MTTKRISELPNAAALAGGELVEVAQLSATIRVAGTDISADAADNSFNDASGGFLTAGFAVGDRVGVSGFATGANNIRAAAITALTAGKMTIGGADGDAIVTEAAGASVVIAKWTSAATSAQDIADLAAGGGGGSAVAVDDEGVEIVALASRLNFVGDGVTVTDGGSGEAIITVPGGGAGGGSAGITLIGTFEAAGGETEAFFDSIPGDYGGLLIFTYLRGESAANDVGLDLRFNDDATASYSWRQKFAPGGDVNVDGASLARTVQFGGSFSPANRFDTGVIEIPFYATGAGSKSGVFRGQNSEGSLSYRNIYGSFNWGVAAAITKVTLLAASGGFAAGSRVAIYGYGSSASGGGGSGGGGSTGALTTVPTSAQWRLRFPDSSKALAAGTSFGVGLSELRWLDEDLTTQLATGGSPIASSVFTSGGSFALAEAYDGSTAASNGWYASEFPSGSFNAWIGYQFPAPVKPAAISFAPLNGFPDTVPASVVVEYLDSAGVWQPIAIFYPGPGVNDTFQTFNLPTSFIKMPADGGARLWAGQGVAIIGDSITEQSPGGVNWAVELRKTLGLAGAPVDGVGGTTMASVSGRIAALDLTSVGSLVIFMGTNDYGNSGGRALGALGDDGADNTFFGDVYEAIEAAMTAKPEIRLIFVTPLQRTDQTAANAQGKVLRDYVDAIIETCARYSIPVYDAHRNIGFNALNFSTYSADGLHPNAIGHRRIARAVAGFLLGT